VARTYNLPFSPSGIVDNVEAFDDLADTIANPPPDRPLRSAIGKSGALFCDAVGATPGALYNLLGPGFAAGALLCDPYWKKKNYTPPVEGSPFSGGQCAGVLYRIVYSWSLTRLNCNGTALSPLTSGGNITLTNRTGPISWADSSAYNACGDGRRSSGSITLTSANHTDIIGASLASGYITSINISIAVSRMDNAADTCGDPSGDAFRPGPSPPPVPSFPPGGEPGAGPGGQPFFKVPDVPSPIVTEPDVPVPDQDTEPGGGGDAGGPTEPPVAGDEQSGTPGDEDFPEPEPGRRWVGCCIRLTTIPAAAGTIPGTSPRTILTEVVGNARLLFDSVNGDGYDTPVQIRSEGLCLWESVKGLSPKGVRVNLKPGFEYAVTPYSVLEDD